ncbi:MAG: hypothetical protein NVS1B4_22020 [Gemmatimonadaceae bacterium]
MNLTRYAAAALALAAVAGGAQAQQASSASPISFGVAGGAAIPTGNLSNGAGTGFRVQGQMNYSNPEAPVNFRVELGYDQFGDKTAPTATLSSRAISGVANAVLPVFSSDDLKPYLIGGVGMYALSGTVKGATIPTTTSSQNNVGFNVGLGTGFGLGGMNAFLEARLHLVMSGAVDATGAKTTGNYFPITFGVNF